MERQVIYNFVASSKIYDLLLAHLLLIYLLHLVEL